MTAASSIQTASEIRNKPAASPPRPSGPSQACARAGVTPSGMTKKPTAVQITKQSQAQSDAVRGKRRAGGAGSGGTGSKRRSM